MPTPHKSRKVKRSLDLNTVLGLVLAVGCILSGLLLENGKLADVAQLAAGLVVLGGTIGAVMITTPLPQVVSALRALNGVLFTEVQPVRETLEQLLAMAHRARRFGMAVLEEDANGIDDGFLKKAVGLIADGTDLRELRAILELEIEAEASRVENTARVWETAAGYAPTVGIMGAVLGLIQVMKHLDHLDEVGRGIAVAFVATLYGVFSANILFLPIAGKLKAVGEGAENLRQMMLEGAVGIADGTNPTLIRIKLESFLPKSSRKAAAGKQESGRPETGTKDTGPKDMRSKVAA
jgi:chemotaxis protein MotA